MRTSGDAVGEGAPSSPVPAAIPISDVSPAVGFVGLAGLLAWVVFCRSYPAIADAMGWGGLHQPLSGPYAAMTGLIAVGLPMVLWSVFVDKVHLRPSTGIDWSLRRTRPLDVDVAVTKIAGLWATWAILGALYCLGRWYWSGSYLFAMHILAVMGIAMVTLSVPYVLWLDRVMVRPRDHAWHFGAMLIGREAWQAEEVWKHWRAWLIKGFFGAFMISIVPGNFANVINAGLDTILSDPVRLAGFMINLLFLIDVMVGTVGYIVTLRPLDAQIRSGNPFLAGWIAALLCYPPFVWGIVANGQVMSYEQNVANWAYWLNGHTAVLWVWAGWLVFLTGVYAWATFAFGIRFSNLTYRGVLTNGPYRFTRHPAYLSKNLFWWSSVMPFLVTSGSPVDAIRNCFCLLLVNGIYFWRAKTEEAHLLLEDAKYRKYHGWMAKNGLITGPLTRLLGRIRPRRVFDQKQPAE